MPQQLSASVEIPVDDLFHDDYDSLIDRLGEAAGGPQAWPDSWTISERRVVAHTDTTVTFHVVVVDGG